jgi:hypothetical protein
VRGCGRAQGTAKVCNSHGIAFYLLDLGVRPRPVLLHRVRGRYVRHRRQPRLLAATRSQLVILAGRYGSGRVGRFPQTPQPTNHLNNIARTSALETRPPNPEAQAPAPSPSPYPRTSEHPLPRAHPPHPRRSTPESRSSGSGRRWRTADGGPGTERRRQRGAAAVPAFLACCYEMTDMRLFLLVLRGACQGAFALLPRVCTTVRCTCTRGNLDADCNRLNTWGERSRCGRAAEQTRRACALHVLSAPALAKVSFLGAAVRVRAGRVC